MNDLTIVLSHVPLSEALYTPALARITHWAKAPRSSTPPALTRRIAPAMLVCPVAVRQH
jgi:hypothetical protein